MFPGLALMLTVLAVNFLGDGLRDALDVAQSQRNSVAVTPEGYVFKHDCTWIMGTVQLDRVIVL